MFKNRPCLQQCGPKAERPGAEGDAQQLGQGGTCLSGCQDSRDKGSLQKEGTQISRVWWRAGEAGIDAELWVPSPRDSKYGQRRP